MVKELCGQEKIKEIQAEEPQEDKIIKNDD